MRSALAIDLLERKTQENEPCAKNLLCSDRVVEDENRTENRKKLPCCGKNRASQRAKPFDREKDEILENSIIIS
jgi:hypothetical protein